MKQAIFLIAAIGFFSFAMAQKKGNEDVYEKIFYKDFTIETGGIIVTVVDAFSNDVETKFKLRITNKTNDYILYKPSESKFVIDGKEMKPDEKWLMIQPDDNASRVINIKGSTYNTIKNYSFVMDGLYKIIMDEKGAAAPDFKLPPAQNDFKAGNFSCNLLKLKKETHEVNAKFTCKYSGDKIGFFNPSKTAVKMPDGNEYANANKKNKTTVLMKGDDDDFTLNWERMQGGKAMDMQMVEMFILWRNAFTEGTPEKMKTETLPMEFDEPKSNEKGK